jgi:predicted ATP-binding protein involved in virulence
MLGIFDHVIDFPESWEFVIMYGPNGVGKTKLLEAADALAKLSINKLFGILFGRLELQFTDGTSLIASKDRRSEQVALHDSEEATSSDENIQLLLVRAGRTVSEVTLTSDDHPILRTG